MRQHHFPYESQGQTSVVSKADYPKGEAPCDYKTEEGRLRTSSPEMEKLHPSLVHPAPLSWLLSPSWLSPPRRSAPSLPPLPTRTDPRSDRTTLSGGDLPDFEIGPHNLARRQDYNQNYKTGGSVNFSPNSNGYSVTFSGAGDFVVGKGWKKGTDR